MPVGSSVAASTDFAIKYAQMPAIIYLKCVFLSRKQLQSPGTVEPAEVKKTALSPISPVLPRAWVDIGYNLLVHNNIM